MSAEEITPDQFEAQWIATERDHRYRYRINRGVVRLYSFLLGLFWAVYGGTVWGKGLTLTLGIVGGLVGLVTVFVFYNMMYWRHYARVSGIISSDDRLVWRNGRSAWSVAWKDIDFEESGLTNHAIGTQAIEHHLRIHGKRLDMTRMHVEMPRIREFMALFLQKMVEHGQIKKGGKSQGGRRK